MEEFLTQLISTNNTVGLISAAVVFVIITLQRNSTKKTRDNDKDNLQTRIALLESKVQKIDELDLAERLASIETTLKYIQMMLENKK